MEDNVKDRAELRPVDDDNVFAIVRSAIAEAIGIDVEEVHRDSALLALGAQSFDFVDVVQKLERAYGIEMSRTYAIPNAHAVGDYVEAVTRELRGDR